MADIGILMVRSFIPPKKFEGKGEGVILGEQNLDPSQYISVSVDVLNDESVLKYSEVEKAEDVYFFGYPALATLNTKDASHRLDPIIRKGIVSKFIDRYKIIIDGFVSSGNSGSPVFVRREFIVPGGGYRIEFRFIGIITEYFPYVLKKQDKGDVGNAGLGLVESVDNILNILSDYEALPSS